MATKYLQVYYTGEVFEYSKTPQPEFEEHTNSKGTKSFRKYYNKGVQGTLESVSIQNSDFGTRVMVTLRSEEDLQIMQFSLNDQRNNIDSFTESLIRVLPNMVKGQEYNIRPYVLSPEFQEEGDRAAGNEVKSKYYDRLGVNVKTVEDGGTLGAKVEYALDYSEGSENSIPRLVWKEDLATKKKKPSAVSLEAKNDFLTAKLMEATEGHLKRETTPSAPQKTNSTPAPKKAEPTKVTTTDDDDLPF